MKSLAFMSQLQRLHATCASDRAERSFMGSQTAALEYRIAKKSTFLAGGTARKFNLVRITLSIKSVQLFKLIPFEAIGQYWSFAPAFNTAAR